MRYALGILLLTCLSLFASAQSTRPANRTPHPTTRPGEIRDLTLDQLGNFDFDPDRPVIPPDVAALNGVTVRLHGFIIPFDQQEKPARFILIRKYWEGGVVTDPDAVPKLQETVIVDCPKEKTVDINRFWKKEVVVEGRLSVGPIKDDGEIVCLFGLQLNGCNLTATATATATTRPAAARTPHPAPVPGETLDLTVAQLGNFDLDFEKPAIPADVAALDGCAVRLHGSLIPLDDDAKCTRFALVPLMLRPVADSRSTCNLEVPPAPSQIVIVQCPREKGMSRTFDQAYEEVVVEGKLSVAIVKDEGYVISIFTVQMDRCKVGATVSGAQTAATTGRSASPIDFHAVSTTQPATARIPNRPPVPGKVPVMSVDRLGNFAFDPNHPVLPPDVKALDGTIVRLHGKMFPLEDSTTPTRFLLIPTAANPFASCCAGPPPGEPDQPLQIQQLVLVHCAKDRPARLTGDEIVVEGKLSVGTFNVDGSTNAVFSLDVDAAKPVRKWTGDEIRTTAPAAEKPADPVRDDGPFEVHAPAK